jgi:hypothetical protein
MRPSLRPYSLGAHRARSTVIASPPASPGRAPFTSDRSAPPEGGIALPSSGIGGCVAYVTAYVAGRDNRLD